MVTVGVLARLEAKPPPTAGVTIARSRRWVDPGYVKGPVRASFHPLIGRIGSRRTVVVVNASFTLVPLTNVSM